VHYILVDGNNLANILEDIVVITFLVVLSVSILLTNTFKHLTYLYLRVCVQAAIAFSVPLTEEEESVVKKHPPKRLRMMEGQQSPPLTHEMLLEKLADAENRRQQVMPIR